MTQVQELPERSRRLTSEAVLVRRLLRNLSTLGRVQKWGVELNAHGSAHLDVGALIAGEMVGIEAKLTDWRRAIGQAALNRYVVDRSYIAIEPTRVRDDVLAVAEEFHIGVLAVEARKLTVVKVGPLLQPDAMLRQRLLERLKTGRRT